MIPKIIHYCWFGGKEKPQSVIKNIELWKKKLPDYIIIEWNESNFDVDSYEFTKEAYSKGKYAFVSDVARLHALSTKGGIYLDTDVEVLKPFDDLLDKDYFFGKEYSGVIGTATIGACQGCQFIQDFLQTYNTRHFINPDGSLCTVPNVVHLTDFQKQYYPDLEILDMYYFSPKHPATRVCKKKDYTYCIHHFDGTWLSEELLQKRSAEGKRIRRREMKKRIVEVFMPWEKAKKIKNTIIDLIR